MEMTSSAQVKQDFFSFKVNSARMLIFRQFWTGIAILQDYQVVVLIH